ncbi:MAG: hypothetical protein HC801_07290 [Nitrospira sp.]|nr:hypothetical protein [Nitrospira sp.]
MGGFFLYLYNQGWTWGEQQDWSSTLYRGATTVTIAGIVFAQVTNVFACRSDHFSVSRLGWFSNPLILWGIPTKLIILALMAYTPFGDEIFGTGFLPLWIFGPLVLGALLLLLAEEGRKIIVNQRNRKIHTQTETTQVTNVS